MEKNIIMGKNLCFEPMKEKIYPFLINWLNDPDIIKFLDDFECKLTLKKIKEIYPLHNIDTKNMLFTIIEKKTKQPIGICGLQKIDNNKKNAFLRIIIGDKKYWNGITALESEKFLLKFAFNKLKLNKVYSIINVNNKGQIQIIERLGMKKDGISRNHFIQNGKYIDASLYSILSSEFKYF